VRYSTFDDGRWMMESGFGSKSFHGIEIENEIEIENVQHC